MTYEERQKWFCEQCCHKDDCGYKNRNMQDDCIENENFMSGWEYGKQDAWFDAQSDHLPPIDKEVVVFTQDFPDDAGMMRVSIGHRPNPDGWDGKSLRTGKVEHYMPRCYDKGGWNIPNVVYWLDIELPKDRGDEIELKK